MRVLLFDIDGTLLLAHGVGKAALSTAMQDEFGIEHPDTEVSFAGRTDRSLTIEILERNGIEPSHENCGTLRRRYVSLMGGELRRQGGIVLPGVRPLLTQVARQANTALAVMTGNYPETATRKLQHFDLRQWFAWISGGDLHIHRDDLARRTAEIVSRRYGDRVSEIVVIGDTPADIACGKAIGAKTVAVATGGHSVESLQRENPCQVFTDFSKTDEVLNAICSPMPG